MYENVGTRVPAEVVELALKKYSERKVSLGRAAKLARMPLVDFMKAAAERRIVINYSVESLEEDFRNLCN